MKSPLGMFGCRKDRMARVEEERLEEATES